MRIKNIENSTQIESTGQPIGLKRFEPRPGAFFGDYSEGQKPLFRHILRPLLLFCCMMALFFSAAMSAMFVYSVNNLQKARNEQKISMMAAEYTQYLHAGNYFGLASSIEQIVLEPSIAQVSISLLNGMVVGESQDGEMSEAAELTQQVPLFRENGEQMAILSVTWSPQPLFQGYMGLMVLCIVLLSLGFSGTGGILLMKLLRAAVLKNIEEIDREVALAGAESQIDIVKNSPKEFVKLVDTINERTARAKHLRIEAERYFRQIEAEKKNIDKFMEQADAGYILFDQEGNFLRSYGVVIERVLDRQFGLNCPNLCEVQEMRDRYAKPVGKHFQSAHHYSITFEGTDGDENYTLIEVTDPNRPSFVMLMNTTLAYRHEQALQKALQAEVVAKLTGGISHDINNLLALLSAMLENIRIRFTESDENKVILKDIDVMLESIDGAASITKQLIGFARNHSTKTEAIEIRTHLQSLFELFARSIGASAGLKIRREDGPDATILADRTMLERAILNMVANARDAMPSGGEIICGHKIVHVGGQKFVRLFVRNPGAQLNEEILRRAFDPFFTTRREQGGTGLGLAMVLGFAKQVHGSASLVNKGGFVEARIDIPLVANEEQEQPKLASDASEKQGERAAERQFEIVVIDDNKLLAQGLARLMTSTGVKARAIYDAAEIAAFAEDSGEVQLVISDVFMPEIDGITLAKKLRENGCNASVLLQTGSNIDKIEHEVASIEGVLVREKPLRLAAIQKIIAEIT